MVCNTLYGVQDRIISVVGQQGFGTKFHILIQTFNILCSIQILCQGQHIKTVHFHMRPTGGASSLTALNILCGSEAHFKILILICLFLLEGLVPDWIQVLLIQARVTSDILDVLRLQRLNLSCSVGLAEMPSANLTSRPLRQVTYGLLLGHILDLDLDLDEHVKVKERDREGLELRFTPVKPTFTTSRLQLSSLNQVTLRSGTSQDGSNFRDQNQMTHRMC